MASVVRDAESRLEESQRPDKHSRWAGGSGFYRYYHAWYSHQPWNNYEFSYRTYYLPGGSEKTYNAMFELNPARAMSSGMTESDIAALRQCVSDYSAENTDANVHDTATRLGVEHSLPAPALDDALRGRVAQLLAELVAHFTPAVEQIVAKQNEESNHAI